MQTTHASLRVTKVIAHDVPARPIKGSTTSVSYSDVESTLTDTTRNYFREKLLHSMSSAGHQVLFNPSTASPVPALLLDYLLGHTTDFVRMSKSIAKHLYESQTGVNSPGLLCLVAVTIDGSPGIAVLKLDREAALRIEQNNTSAGATYDLEHIRNLILSERTKVFKAALFLLSPTPDDATRILGTVSDNQRAYAPLSEVADFFLKGFLGCTFAQSPSEITKKYFLHSQDFFLSEIDDADKQADYVMALISDMNSNQGTVSPRAFADNHLHLDDRQEYIDSLANNDLPVQEFTKDISSVKTQIRKMRIAFESGVNVFVPPGTLDKEVVVSSLDDGRAHLQVRDRVVEMRGR